jgi:GNAT superfamily N-acetyltransferase
VTRASGDEARSVARLAAGDADAAGRVLGSAFVDDPLMRYYFEGDRERALPVRATMTLAVQLTLRHGTALRADCGGELAGVALLLPPAVPDFPLADVVAAVLRTPRLWRPRALRRHFGVSASVEAHRPRTPCWVLLSLGVAPARQRRGHGAWLLERVLESLAPWDAVCLETDNDRNLPFYARLGFAVTAEYLADAGRGPRPWSLVRPAQATRG